MTTMIVDPYTSSYTGGGDVWIDNTTTIDGVTTSNPMPLSHVDPAIIEITSYPPYIPHLLEGDKLKEGELVKMKDPKKYRYKKERLFMVKTILFDVVNGYEKGWCFLQQVGRSKFLVGPMQDFEKVM